MSDAKCDRNSHLERGSSETGQKKTLLKPSSTFLSLYCLTILVPNPLQFGEERS